MKISTVKSAPLNDNDLLRLDKFEDARFQGCNPGDVLVLFYAEACTHDGEKGFTSVCTEYFAVSELASAEAAFEKRLKADNPCARVVGRSVEQVLGRAA